VGTSYKNTKVYIGRGWFDKQFQPGRVDVTSGTAGTYISSSAGEQKLTKQTEYLVVSSNCSCTWMAPTTANTHEGLVRVYGNDFHYAIGRVALGNNQVGISKVMTPNMDQWFFNPSSGKEEYGNATEVLVCETTGDNSVRPIVNFTTAACGMYFFILKS
jgi:hypothetical protein